MRKRRPTLILSGNDVNKLLDLATCILVVEEGFRLLGQGKMPPPKVLALHAEKGGLHIKAATLPGDKSYFVAKANANFPGNGALHGLPTIQGIVVLVDASTGELLALMDSIELTVQRTGAATAVAAKYLARTDAQVATICGCGRQGYIQLKSLLKVRPIERVFVYDIDAELAGRFAAQVSGEFGINSTPAPLPDAVRKSDVIVTCTPSQHFFVNLEDVKPGTFIAAVGADNEQKQEIDPRLFATSKVVVDSLDQCSTIGDLHHAIAQGVVTRSSVHAELAEVAAKTKTGRESREEITIFDSTGVALEDAVTAAYIYKRATEQEAGVHFQF